MNSIIGYFTAPLFLLVPVVWLVLLPLEFLLNSIVLFVGLKMTGSQNIFSDYKKLILRVWRNSFISDILSALLGGVLASLISSLGEAVKTEQLNALGICIASVLSSLVVYLLSRRVIRKNLELEDNPEFKKLAWMLASFTSPLVIGGCLFWGGLFFK
ncbi:MAG: hypothetical protein LBI55_02320 [Oscillospiraceae bacterium]|jgi:hypothetical protein|nr:hypothetical protein [Oscillospiraceae bacterium]